MPSPSSTQPTAQIGVTGLAVMGSNLARNFARHGHTVAVHNRSSAKTKALIEEHGHEGSFVPAETAAEFVAALQRPRRLVIMVKAGAPTDAVIEEFAPLLEEGDVIIDGGNAHFDDTRRREKALRERGLHFVGTGISGGEEGALNGPSIMPGGSSESYKSLGPLLESISAKVDGTPCCTHIGPDGAGHFVKMVHNGIEYADMQTICEAYWLMSQLLGMQADEMAGVFAEWNQGELASYLVGITADILRHTDAESGQPLVDLILDTAEQKGTGKWASQAALDLGVTAPTIADAVFARTVSAVKDERVAASTVLAGAETKVLDADRAAFVGKIRRALLAAKVCAYAQGFQLLRAADREYQWDLPFDTVASLWRAGCIIRARLLEDIRKAWGRKPDLANLLVDEYFARVMAECQEDLREVVATAAMHGVAVPAFMSALAYYDAYRSPRLPANLLQAQRDYFGAHTYQRIDRAGKFHTKWK